MIAGFAGADPVRILRVIPDPRAGCAWGPAEFTDEWTVAMIIAQITDTHLRGRDSADAEAIARAENLRRCIAHITTRTPKPDLVIHTGDMTERGKAEEFAHVREIIDALDIPIYVLPGNRDGRSGVRRGFADHGYLPEGEGFLNYVIEEHPVRVVALDSIDVGSPMGLVCDARLAWLESTLASRAETPTVLAMHHPPFDVAEDHPFAFHDRANADALSDVVRRHRQVIRVLCGHVHRPRQVAWGGTTGSTTPCVAGDLRKGPALRESDGRPVDGTPVYEIHALDSHGGFESTLHVVRSN